MRRMTIRSTHLRYSVVLGLPALLLLGAPSCPLLDQGRDDEDQPQDTQDDGPANTGEGEGEGEHTGGGEGEGEGEVTPPLTGIEYTGTAEEGVVCGETTCALEDPCCVNLVNFHIVATCSDGNGCAAAQGDFPCDGPEDCAETQECCITSDSAPTLTSHYEATCIDIGTCATSGAHVSVACLSTADCTENQLCCSLAPDGFKIPVDIGVCSPAADNCTVQLQ